MKTTPEAAGGRLPLKGATPMARQSRFHGVCLVGFLTAAGVGVLK
jgi:hypothetical protein